MRNPGLVSSPLAEGTSSTPKALTTQKEKGDKVERVSQERCEFAQGLEKELYHINLVGRNPPQHWEGRPNLPPGRRAGCRKLF